MAEMTVRIEGTVPTSPTGTQAVSGTVTANQGTAAATASAWPIKVTDGSATASIAVPGTGGSALLVATGTGAAVTTLSAVSAAGNGSTVDFGAAHANISLMVVPSAGVSAGTASLQVSHDGTSWVKFGTSTAALVAGTNQQLTATGVAFRFARGVVDSGGITGGTVTATIAAS